LARIGFDEAQSGRSGTNHGREPLNTLGAVEPAGRLRPTGSPVLEAAGFPVIATTMSRIKTALSIASRTGLRNRSIQLSNLIGDQAADLCQRLISGNERHCAGFHLRDAPPHLIEL